MEVRFLDDIEDHDVLAILEVYMVIQICDCIYTLCLDLLLIALDIDDSVLRHFASRAAGGKAAAHTPALLSVIFSSDHCRQRLGGKCGSLGRPCFASRTAKSPRRSAWTTV